MKEVKKTSSVFSAGYVPRPLWLGRSFYDVESIDTSAKTKTGNETVKRYNLLIYQETPDISDIVFLILRMVSLCFTFFRLLEIYHLSE